MPFTEFPIPTQALGGLDPNEFPMTALEFTPNQVWNAGFIGHNAYHGQFWDESDTPGNCFWEAWVTAEYTATYVIAGGNGGSHPVLFGFDGASSGKLKLSGNVYDGSSNISFTSVDSIDPGTWHHIAMGVDHTANFIYVYLDGVLTNRVSFTGTRTVGGSSADLGLMIGGNDHASHKGKILRVRGFENQIPFNGSAFPNAFHPEKVFNSTRPDSTTEFAAQFVADYSTKNEALIDYSSGYNGTTHSGKRAIGSEGMHTGSDAKLPQWVLAEFEKPEYTGTPESIPASAIIFDDFSRDNETFAWAGAEDTEYPYVGTARTGQAWIGTSGGAPAGQPDVGILEGSAVSLDVAIANGSATWIDANATNYVVTIDRLGSEGIGVIVRRADANNYALVSISSTACEVYENVAGGGLGIVDTLTAPTDPAWTRATVTLAGTAITVAITGGGGGSTALDAALTGELVGFSVAGLARVRRFLVV